MLLGLPNRYLIQQKKKNRDFDLDPFLVWVRPGIVSMAQAGAIQTGPSDRIEPKFDEVGLRQALT